MNWKKLSKEQREAKKENAFDMWGFNNLMRDGMLDCHHINRNQEHNHFMNLIIIGRTNHGKLHNDGKESGKLVRDNLNSIILTKYANFFVEEINPITKRNFTIDEIITYVNFCTVEKWGLFDKDKSNRHSDEVRAFFQWFDKEEK